MQHLSIPIAGMSCGSCVRHVRDALAAIPGVQVDSVSVGKADVTFDPAITTADTLRAAISRVGYQPLAA